MFWKKKRKEEEQIDTPLDKAIKDKSAEIMRARVRIREAVINLFISKGVMALYPEGPDKQIAAERARTFTECMMGAIGTYDRLRDEYEELLKKEGERNTTKGIIFGKPPSITVVESAYREFYRM